MASILWCNFSGWEVASYELPNKVVSKDRIFHWWKGCKIEITKEWEYCCSVANFGTAAHWASLNLFFMSGGHSIDPSAIALVLAMNI